MRAVRFHGRGDIRVDQIEEPVCGAGEVKIRPAFVGICGSDLHEYLAGPLTIPSTPHAVTGATLPVTLGHEFSGTVEEVGADTTTRLKVGDRVAVKPNLYDGSCASCLMGRVNCCRNLGFIGYSSNAGGLSDHVVVKEQHAIPLPGSFPLDIGALVEPLTIAWHAVKRSPITAARTALVIGGGGPIGLAIVQALRAHGMQTIIVAEVSRQRQTYTRTLGATDVVDPTAEDAVARVRAMTEGAGADVAFECSGVQAGLDAAVGGIRTRGTVTVVSLWETRPAIDAFEVVSSEKHVIGAVVCDDGDFEAVIEAIWSGRLDPRAMITSKIRMEEVEEKGFKALISQRDRHVKILVDIAA